MDNKDVCIEAGEWVVHIDVKIWGTIVWEGIINSFENKREAELWQEKFMRHAPQECSTALILSDNAPPPQDIAAYLKKEIERFIAETMEE